MTGITGLVLVAALLACPRPPEPPGARLSSAGPAVQAEGEAAELPPRRPIAGSYGFQSVSKLTYDARPDLPHTLEASYQFPARVRWRIQLEGSHGGRIVEYRAGQRVYRLPPRSSESVAVEGAELAALIARMELRRAATFWPDGFDWEAPPLQETAERRRALLTNGNREGEGSRTREAPQICEARLGKDGRPTAFALLDAEGRERERLEVHGWKESGGRLWPTGFDLHANGQLVWTEEIVKVTDDVYFVDVAFLPPDRRLPSPRTGASTGAAGAVRVRSVDLVPHTVRRIPFEDELDWEAALEAARALAEHTTQKLGLAVDSTPTLEVDRQGRPVAVLVRLAQPSASPPEAFETVPERPGLLGALAGPESCGSLLQELVQRVPDGTRPGAAYVRLYAGPPGPRWELALPLEPIR